ncbi:uncharacterized protein LOC121430822 [Lytechinus variegatus]|uniref:uncharacterized protein LOC121430822 n=1 Tax=Lytechinus variegatus TaxID=7654 RepID=UPI001BB25D28|nr:uncharacterized protein LOC121430822 [Lytechinus variegatus]
MFGVVGYIRSTAIESFFRRVQSPSHPYHWTSCVYLKNMATIKMIIITLLLAYCGDNNFVSGVITDVRLVGGPSPDKGTVQIMQDIGTWNTTCGINFDINDVIVICKQLGYTGANRAIISTPYGQDSTPQTGLRCNGDEKNLAGCELLPASTCQSAGAASCHGENYLGCYGDKPTDRVFPGDSLLSDPDMTISYCIQYCNSIITSNYVYAGVENGNECFCGEEGDNYTKHEVASDRSCQTACQGNDTESCGGSGYIAVFRIPSPTTASPDVSPTISMVTGSGTPTTAPPITTAMSQSPVDRPRKGGDGGDIGLYAGVAGGVVVVIIIVIVVVLCMRKRSRREQKRVPQSQGMTMMEPSSPNSTQDNLYHDMFVDMTDESLQAPPESSTDNDVTYYSSMTDREQPGTEDTYYSSVKEHGNTDEPHTEDGGSPDNAAAPMPSNGGIHELYATPDKTTKSKQQEDFGALYAKPDKTGKGGDGQAPEDFAALYAMPDKSRGTPEGREDVDTNPAGLENRENTEEGPYSLADNDDTGLYAMSTAPGHIVSEDPDEYGIVMVDNELYAM